MDWYLLYFYEGFYKNGLKVVDGLNRLILLIKKVKKYPFRWV